MLPENLNIVYVADIPQVGGASASLFDLVRRMTEQHGANCTVLLPSNGPLSEKLEAAGISTLITGHRGFLVSKPALWLKIAPKYIIELVGYLANREPSVKKAETAIDFSKVGIIHSNLPRNDLGMLLAKRYGIPHVCHLREYSFEDFDCWSYRKAPATYLDTGTDAFIAISEAVGNAWMEKGVNPSKMHIVHNGIDVDAFRQRMVAHTPTTNRKTEGSGLKLVFLGGCSETKGVWDAVEAMELLPERLYSSVTLDIYGYGSSNVERKLRRHIAKHRLENRVALHGPSEDIASILPAYDCGLVCSKSEAFGRVVVEYFAAGLTVICSNTGALPELLEQGKRGILYDKSEGAPSLANSIAELASNTTKLNDLKLASSFAATDYDIDRTIEGVAAVYEELLDSCGDGLT